MDSAALKADNETMVMEAMTGPADAKQQVVDFLTGFSIETTPGSAAKIQDYRALLRPGTTVNVTHLPGSDFLDTVTTAKRLPRCLHSRRCGGQHLRPSDPREVP